MGKLLDEFDNAKKVWRQDPESSRSRIIHIMGYSAFVTQWGKADCSAGVEHEGYSGSRTILSPAVLDYKDTETAKAAVLDAIQKDIIIREFMAEGPERMKQLEAEVKTLRSVIDVLAKEQNP